MPFARGGVFEAPVGLPSSFFESPPSSFGSCPSSSSSSSGAGESSLSGDGAPPSSPRPTLLASSFEFSGDLVVSGLAFGELLSGAGVREECLCGDDASGFVVWRAMGFAAGEDVRGVDSSPMGQGKLEAGSAGRTLGLRSRPIICGQVQRRTRARTATVREAGVVVQSPLPARITGQVRREGGSCRDSVSREPKYYIIPYTTERTTSSAQTSR